MAEYIERDAVLSDLEAAEKHGGMGMIIANTLKRYVKRVPSADVAPVVHARWIWSPDVTEDVDTLRCSHCKKEAPGSYTEEGDFVYHKTDFCPHCGTKMDLESEGYN